MTVTNSEFLRHLAAAAPRGSSLWVNGASGWPAGPADQMRFWAGQPWVGSEQLSQVVDSWHDRNAYFSVAALRADDSGEVRRRKANFVRLLALVVDDADQDGLTGTPSWIIQTSPGKHQIGVFLDRDDNDCADARLVDALVTRMARQGLLGADKAGNNICRYVRLPCGQNQKTALAAPFQVEVIACRPSVCLSLDDAAAVFGIDLDAVKAELGAQPAAVSTGLVAGEQADKLRVYAHNVMRGENLHDSINELAASMVASGAHGGAVTNMLRAMMDASVAMRDDRFMERYADIPRAVMTAEAKFRAAAPPPEIHIGISDTPAEPRARNLVQINGLLGAARPIDWLIKGWLEMNALSMVFGPAGVGKSFVMIDWACCIATGKSWHGRPVKQGPVIYVAGEGHNGFSRRLLAWQKIHGVSLRDAPIYLSNKAVQFLDEQSADDLLAEVDEICRQHNLAPSAVIVDTLARNFGAGDENKQQDAGLFIDRMDAMRLRYGCNVLVVHHTGKVSEDTARGSSVFRGAMDQELAVTGRGGNIQLKATKMKEAEEPAPVDLALRQTEIGTDDEDAPITGAALEIAGNPLDFVVGSRTTGDELKALEVVDAIKDGWPGPPALCAQLGCSDKALTKIMKRLRDDGLVEYFDGKKSRPTERAMGFMSTRGVMVAEKAAAERQAAADADEAREAAYAATLEGGKSP